MEFIAVLWVGIILNLQTTIGHQQGKIVNDHPENSGMLLVDTHCHLTQSPLIDDVEGVIQRAADRTVSRLIIPAYDQPSWGEILEVAKRPGIYPALGLHPWVADQLVPGEQLKQALNQTIVDASIPVVAIGEIGLDTRSDGPLPLDIQMAVLDTQLELAVDLDLPVILHCRGAFNELYEAVIRHGGRIRGILHAFSRGPELVQRFHGTGLYFGLGGAVTRENARKIRRGARVIPLNRICLETDAPSIGLQGVRPEHTEPHHVADVAVALAELREEDLSLIARETTANALRLFHLPS